MAITIWSGLTEGALYAIVATGFTLGLLPSGVFNFAQGGLVVAGTYLAFFFFKTVGLPLVPVIVLLLVSGAIMGAICELTTIRPLARRRGSHAELVTTVGMATAIVGACGIAWGYLPIAVPFHGPTGIVKFLGVRASPVSIFLVVGSIVVVVACSLWFRMTRTGQACLAASENPDAARLRGINVSRLSLGAFAVAGALAGVAALVIGPITFAVPGLANNFALGGFVAIAIGGQRNFFGGLAGGLLVGIVSALAGRYIGAEYSNLAILALLVTTLTIRPSGLGGLGEVRRV
ncbi:MAG: branched-chain amino acid transport system permease protein [Solirubrobacteraceae bacterium]|jgi:branched-chain amino acid transport system permease protein|nr:branched-chain amino acid transport system permease protein [Solirubrobacteraceae bacterium]